MFDVDLIVCVDGDALYVKVKSRGQVDHTGQ